MARVSEMREVAGFREIVIEGFGDAEIEQTEPGGPEFVEVEADEALIEHIKTEVRDGRLHVGLDIPWWEWLTYWPQWLSLDDRRVRYRIAMQAVDGARINGSGSVTAGPVRSERLRLIISGSGKIVLPQVTANTIQTTISGSGEVTLGGAAEQHTIHISGSGDIRATELVTEETEVHISGSGKVQANAEDTLDVHISGAGEVRYLGQPRVTQSVGGSGSIRSLS